MTASRSWQWLFTSFDQTWVRKPVQSAVRASYACTADSIVGSSMGGVVIVNLPAA